MYGFAVADARQKDARPQSGGAGGGGVGKGKKNLSRDFIGDFDRGEKRPRWNQVPQAALAL